jgi:hypothetical protein
MIQDLAVGNPIRRSVSSAPSAIQEADAEPKPTGRNKNRNKLSSVRHNPNPRNAPADEVNAERYQAQGKASSPAAVCPSGSCRLCA